jgi:hypothetical protein
VISNVGEERERGESDSRAPRVIFGEKREEITGRLHIGFGLERDHCEDRDIGGNITSSWSSVD